MRFVAYLCAMIESDVSSPNSPNRPDTWMVRILVYYSCISLRDREHTRAIPYLYNEQKYGRKSKEGSSPRYEGGNYQGTSDGQSPRPQDRFE